MRFTIRVAHKNELSHEFILKAALQLIENSGLKSLSMRKIATLIDCSPASIYSYFAGKDALLHALAKRGFVKLFSAMVKAEKESAAPLKQIQKMCLAYAHFAGSHGELFELMFGTVAARRHPWDASKDFQSPLEAFKPAINRLFENSHLSQQERLAKAYTVWAMVHGMACIRMSQDGRYLQKGKRLIIEATNIICSFYPDYPYHKMSYTCIVTNAYSV